MARIGPYTVADTLGRGGYGEVLAGVHDVIGREVAIKVLHAKWSDDVDAVRRFVNEAQAVNAVRHANIVDIVDFGTLEDGRHYHVMERLRGETLRARLDARGALAIDEAFPILRAIASALDAAHDAGIVHRDIKPENVFLHLEGDREIVKLIDFGLAKLARQSGAPTQSGIIIGTPAYMAPEQCRGQAIDRRTDAYAFGVLAYEMLAGKPPLRGNDPVATLLAHVHETPLPPSKIADLPRAIDAVFETLLAKSPARRPERLAPVIDAIAACKDAPVRRSRIAWIAIGGSIAIAGGALALVSTARDPDSSVLPIGLPPIAIPSVVVDAARPIPPPPAPITVDASAGDLATTKPAPKPARPVAPIDPEAP